MPELDIDVDFSVKDWGDGFNGIVSLTNNGEELAGWQIEFDAPYEITQVWNAELISKEGNKYTIGDLANNDNVSSGETVTFEFKAWEDNPSKPSNFKINGVAIVEEEFSPSPTPEPTPKPPGGVTRPDYNKSEGFFTKNGKLYDANGNEFVARGINNAHIWWDDNGDDVTEAKDAIDNIADFGFNSTRIVWRTETKSGKASNDALLEDIIQRNIDEKMIPMVELHDFTGSTDTKDLLNRGVKWWTERASLWEKFEKHLTINIANEFGDWGMSYNGDREVFADVYKEAISRIRNAGIDNTLVIDPFHYGKDYKLIEEYGQEIIDSDPQKNVVFSIHFYAGEGESQEKIADAFDSLTGKEIPMLIGEFAHYSSPTDADIQEEFIMEKSQEYGVGYYGWEWVNRPDPVHQVATTWEADSNSELTDWGKTLIYDDNGIAATSETASIFS